MDTETQKEIKRLRVAIVTVLTAWVWSAILSVVGGVSFWLMEPGSAELWPAVLMFGGLTLTFVNTVVLDLLTCELYSKNLKEEREAERERRKAAR